MKVFFSTVFYAIVGLRADIQHVLTHVHDVNERLDTMAQDLTQFKANLTTLLALVKEYGPKLAKIKEEVEALKANNEIPNELLTGLDAAVTEATAVEQQIGDIDDLNEDKVAELPDETPEPGEETGTDEPQV